MGYRIFCKYLQLSVAVSSLVLTGCAVNPATGKNQFTALMPAGSEASIGASQHAEILKQYGGLYKDQSVQSYVTRIGKKVAKDTERTDVNYQFFVLDSPIVNAFALPGGYVYVTRGLLAVAKDEAELAGVLGHEVGHVTARHQAARYSQGVLTSLGTTLLGQAIGSPVLSQAIDTGSNLYMSSYSRDQESEADGLGMRYMFRAGYDPKAMSDFLSSMDLYQKAQSGEAKAQQPDFFATHPQTSERVAATSTEAAKYSKGLDARNKNEYLSAIDGLAFGDSAEQGFIKGNVFTHPQLGFSFTVPSGYHLQNKPEQVVAAKTDGALIVVDHANSRTDDPEAYITSEWLQDKKPLAPERITVSGHKAATASFNSTLNGKPVQIGLLAINWARGEMYRMQFAIPAGMPASQLNELKETIFSFRPLSKEEINSYHSQRIKTVVAGSAETVQSLVNRMDVDNNPTDLFQAINGLNFEGKILPGQKYKIITR